MRYLEIFNHTAASVFGQCYTEFPKGINIDAKSGIDPSDFPAELRSAVPDVWHSSVTWLAQEKFIHYQTSSFLSIAGKSETNESTQIIMYPCFSGVMLATRGFEALSSKLPNSIAPDQTVGGFLADQTKESLKSARAGTISQIVGLIIGGAAKSFFGG
jgi:hypothetical protein